jgi:phosphohistidine phosphatase
MKTILLLRHAKSDWGMGVADFDRPLNKRGLNDASLMGKLLAQAGMMPDRILSSPAFRAKQTTELVAEACGYEQPIQWEKSFYEGGSADLITALQQLPASIESAMLVGHNPIMENVASRLCTNTGSFIQMPTAALVCLEVNINNWAELRHGEAILSWFLIPRLVKAIQN